MTDIRYVNHKLSPRLLVVDGVHTPRMCLYVIYVFVLLVPVCTQTVDLTYVQPATHPNLKPADTDKSYTSVLCKLQGLCACGWTYGGCFEVLWRLGEGRA